VSAGDAALVVAQLLAFALVGGATSSLALRRAGLTDLGAPERALLTVVGFLCFSVALMVTNGVTGGLTFGTPGVVPVLGAAVVALRWARARPVLPRPSRGWWGPAALGAALVLVYLLPVLLEGSGVRTGDPPWHLGWTEQLLGGERVPVGPAPELARNAYPWGYHAFLAALVRLVPGSTPLLAHETVHVILLAAIPLAAACLARRVDRRAGLTAAACTALIGGWGWLAAREPAFVPSPRESRYGADLVVASPNSVYELTPPALPRELGLVMAGATALVLLLALERGTRAARAAAGVSAGLVGVVSVPMLTTALAWTLAGCALLRGRRRRAALEIVLPALAVFGVWAAPVAVGYLQHGGFVDITPRLGMEWALPTALGSYGLLLPAALAGMVLARRNPGGRVLLALLVPSAALLGLAVARDVFDWSVWNNATLLHQGRMWPPVHLLAGALGGVALLHVSDAVRMRSRALAATAVVGVLAVGAASPVLASMKLREIVREERAGFEYADDDFAPGSFVREAATFLGPRDVVGGPGGEVLWALFQLSGARLATFDDPRFDGNDLRIRYAELAHRWDEEMASDGFRPNYLVIPAGSASPGRVLVEGEFEGERWSLLSSE
jgi:hypothetical protein